MRNGSSSTKLNDKRRKEGEKGTPNAGDEADDKTDKREAFICLKFAAQEQLELNFEVSVRILFDLHGKRPR